MCLSATPTLFGNEGLNFVVIFGEERLIVDFFSCCTKLDDKRLNSISTQEFLLVDILGLSLSSFCQLENTLGR
jgi:hypothetical protein